MKPGSSVPRPEITSALEGAGVLGITARQLAVATDLPLVQVMRELSDLSTSGRIRRVGRDLWMPRRFAENVTADSEFIGPEWYLGAFKKSFGIAPGTRTGGIQFRSNDDLPVHSWWPYVQGFSAEFVRETARRYGMGRGSTILDPFAGSGTVLVESRLLGATSVGIELMPIAAFVAKAKQNWDVDPARLQKTAEALLSARKTPPHLPPPFLRETSRQFREDVMGSLLRIKEGIWDLPDGPVKTAMKLCFAGILVESSNLKRSPCLGYGNKEGLSGETPYLLFKRAADRMVSDLRWLRSIRIAIGPEATVMQEDAGRARLPESSVDLAITSPPYVNGMDYVMNYKIELAWLDMAKSYADLSRLKRVMVACDNVSKDAIAGHQPGDLVAEDEWISSILGRMRENLDSKSGYRRKDMDGVVAKYFDDLCPVIENVFDSLRPGSRFVVVNGDSLMAGTYIPGDLIFARLAKAVGFEIEDLRVARRRRSGQRRSFMLRESILTLRKPS